MSRRVVITGLGLVSPLGNSAERLGGALAAGESGIRPLASIPTEALPTKAGAECRDFTGSIEEFGPLDKAMSRQIKKNLRVMCREIQMGVAVAQLALSDGGLDLAKADRDRTGVVYGSDYMLTLPQEFMAGVRNCLDSEGNFDFTNWAEKGLPAVEPLWLLKYLPNLPASHIAIFNELRGPNNSLTVREASSNLAIAEAFSTIVRGHADTIITGATGTKIHAARTIHVVTQEEVATGDGDPARLSRPFDLHRQGAVLGEGAAALLLEELGTAQARGAKILGEVIGAASSTVADRYGVGQIRTAVKNVLSLALKSAGLSVAEVGHVHAHGLSTVHSDVEEAQAIAEVFGSRKVPVFAAKSYFGNLGAAGGMIELIASLLAMNAGPLYRTLNHETPDPDCPVHVVTDSSTPAGDVFVNVNVTPQGQASAAVVKKFA
ncbi:MAG: beta-ketoacyl-[acyl-carrier-protein] synthase family protein [Pirellulaceae bacterium]|nr:beta-ketoacyl-[acyl-carrier-protein] synthase family protein [Pirellulaceae bacterium]